MTRSTQGPEPETSTLVLSDAERPRPRLNGARIRVLDARAKPSQLRLTVGSCRIGSGAACDVVIEEATVSRVHVELSVTKEGILVEDLGSRNGTFYLDQRISKIVLAPGARIRVGGTTVAIEPDDEATSDEPYTEGAYAGLFGEAHAMREVFRILRRLEKSLTTVLVEGESGVGKELVARAIHTRSQVSSGPLVVLNCGALPRDLLGSELFGHRRGAFTGASEARKGAFESAEGGTLFLDEIGELPLDVQPMLLRALEYGEVRAVGSDSSTQVKVRILAATNRDLAELVEEGKFREDLFYRLAVVRLRIPPLRDRVEDVAALAQLFAGQLGLSELPLSVLEQLKSRPWPGNVRELRNAIQAFAALGVLPAPNRSRTATLELALRETIDTKVPYAEQKAQLQERFMAVYLRALHEETGGNVSVATKLAGLDRGYLVRLLAKYGIAERRGR